MKPYLQLLTNWRIVALMLLSTVAMMLILSECVSLTALLITKLTGFALAYGCYRLSQHWDKKGLINELNIFDAQ